MSGQRGNTAYVTKVQSENGVACIEKGDGWIDTYHNLWSSVPAFKHSSGFVNFAAFLLLRYPGCMATVGLVARALTTLLNGRSIDFT
jgi:hypothetical protein